MNEQRFDTNDTPHVMLQQAQGTVTIGSWIRSAVTVTGETATAVAPEANLVTITAVTDIQIMMPTHGRLTIETVQGNLTIKHVAGLAKIGQVHGDLTLKNVGDVQVDVVQGALHGEGIDGPLTAGDVGQQVTLRNTHQVEIRQAQQAASIRYVNGRVTLGHVGGSLDLHTISEDLTITEAGADVKLSNLGGQNKLLQAQGPIFLVGGLVMGEHSFTGQDDIFVYWPSAAPVNLVATAAKISNRLRLRQAGETSEGETVTLTGFIEHRKTFLILKTPGRMGLVKWDRSGEPAFTATDFDFTEPTPAAPPVEMSAALPIEAVGIGIGTAVSQGVANVINRLELELGPEWGRRFAALELEEKFVAAITAELSHLEPPVPSVQPTPGTAAFHKAEQKVAQSLQKVTATMDKTRKKLTAPQTEPTPSTAAETTAVDDAPPPPTTPIPAADAPIPAPAAQLRILDMLEKGVISVSEASELLQALW